MSPDPSAAAAAAAMAATTAALEAELAASLVDDCMDGFAVSTDADATSDSMMISMEQLLDDANANANANHAEEDDEAPAASSSSRGTPGEAVHAAAALEPSIVSGTTDLFEGDLCDDELDGTLGFILLLARSL